MNKETFPSERRSIGSFFKKSRQARSSNFSKPSSGHPASVMDGQAMSQFTVKEKKQMFFSQIGHRDCNRKSTVIQSNNKIKQSLSHSIRV
jgi:hypothetical protein